MNLFKTIFASGLIFGASLPAFCWTITATGTFASFNTGLTQIQFTQATSDLLTISNFNQEVNFTGTSLTIQQTFDNSGNTQNITISGNFSTSDTNFPKTYTGNWTLLSEAELSVVSSGTWSMLLVDPIGSSGLATETITGSLTPTPEPPSLAALGVSLLSFLLLRKRSP